MIGYPILHSRSPAIHNAAARATGVDLVYSAIPVLPGELSHALDEMRRLRFVGLSVTMPHKEAVIPELDELTPAAVALGAVNHITNIDGRLIGNNTDGEGFLLGLRVVYGIDVAGSRVGVIGAGGAARAIVRACAEAGAAQVVVIARNTDRALAAVSVGEPTAQLGDITCVDTLDIVVNATPIGMGGTPHAAETPFDVETLADGSVVVDIVYDPLETPLLAAARERGLVGIDGLAMLAGQAAAQFEAWTGVAAPLNVMIDAARSSS